VGEVGQIYLIRHEFGSGLLNFEPPNYADSQNKEVTQDSDVGIADT